MGWQVSYFLDRFLVRIRHTGSPGRIYADWGSSCFCSSLMALARVSSHISTSSNATNSVLFIWQRISGSLGWRFSTEQGSIGNPVRVMNSRKIWTSRWDLSLSSGTTSYHGVNSKSHAKRYASNQRVSGNPGAVHSAIFGLVHLGIQFPL